ncbi:MAG TPA: hypothetical protein VK445_04935 [Dissulfurispiraceae bacterium]|nr:hypothetical protein [Dissulfurispiraceae bacterium]
MNTVNDRFRFFALLGLPLALTFILVAAARSIHFEPAISTKERSITTFANVSEPSPYPAPMHYSALRNPFLPGSGRGGYPDIPLDALTAGGGAQQRALSLILINANKKTAVINGKVVNEGASIDGARVAKIEKNRVLLQSKGGQEWLELH